MGFRRKTGSDICLAQRPREVEAWFEAPVSLLFNRDNWIQRSTMWKGEMRHYLDMEYEGFRIWG